MRKVLVFGAAGFIGNALVRELLQQRVEVIAVIPSKKTDTAAVNAVKDLRVKVIECDLQDVKEHLKSKVCEEIDVCYFLAWDGLTSEGLSDYEKQIKNVIYMLDLMKAVKDLGCKKFIGAGSITQQELFSKEGREYLTDKHKYFRSAQQACEDMGRCLANEENMIFIWPLITNIYGEGEHSPRFINTTIRKLLQGESVPTSKGNQLYDFVYIKDAVDAYIRLGDFGKNNRKYIIGSGSPKPLREFLERVEEAAGALGRIEYGKFVYNGVYYTEKEYEISQLTEDTGYMAGVDFETGIKNTIAWIGKEMINNGTVRKNI